MVKKVEKLFAFCILKKEEDDLSCVITINGVFSKNNFNKNRLSQSHKEIENILLRLPNEFKESVGGGWCFSNLSMDQDGNMWTNSTEHLDQLVQLGIGIQKIECLIPKRHKDDIPYYTIIDK